MVDFYFYFSNILPRVCLLLLKSRICVTNIAPPASSFICPIFLIKIFMFMCVSVYMCVYYQYGQYFELLYRSQEKHRLSCELRGCADSPTPVTVTHSTLPEKTARSYCTFCLPGPSVFILPDPVLNPTLIIRRKIPQHFVFCISHSELINSVCVSLSGVKFFAVVDMVRFFFFTCWDQGWLCG